MSYLNSTFHSLGQGITCLEAVLSVLEDVPAPGLNPPSDGELSLRPLIGSLLRSLLPLSTLLVIVLQP